MRDEYFNETPLPPVKKPRGRKLFYGTLLLLLAALGLSGWAAWEGLIKLPGVTIDHSEQVALPLSEPTARYTPPPPGTPSPAAPAPELAVGGLEGRLALLEDRLSRIDVQADAASGNAARAEALLIAFAARRMIERGAPLGYLENQLQLRFANAQPNAVSTVIKAAHAPVTLDVLLAQLEAAGPALTGGASSGDIWGQVKREVSGLFIIRHQAAPSASHESRVTRARLMLASGKVDAAVAEVERLPGAANASAWIASARRYAEVQRALDLLETTAMLEPRLMQDSTGERVEQSSPLVAPVSPELEALPSY